MMQRFYTIRGKLLGLVCLALIALPIAAHAARQSGLLQARQGVSALLRGKYEKAIDAYTKALEDKNLSDPRRANIYNDRGVAKWRLKDTQAAVDDFNKAIKLFPDYSVVYNNRGNALMDLGRSEEAIADFDRAITLAAAYGVAFNNRGNAYFALRDYAAAARDFRKAAQLMPTNAVPFNGRGKTHSARGNRFAAIRDFNRAITLNAKYSSALENRAETLAALNKHNAAIFDFNHTITQRPSDPALYLARGRAYVAAGKYNSAFRDFDKALKLAPEMAEIFAARAQAHSRLKRFKAASADLAKAIALDPVGIKAFIKRAETYLRLGRAQEGLADANYALEFQPSDTSALVVRARIYEALERGPEAVPDYIAVLRHDPDNKQARAGLTRLGSEVPPVAKPATLGEPVKGWGITRTQDGNYTAVNPRYPKARVRLEMYGEGAPKIIAWSLLKYELRGIGLLEYYAGTVPEDGGRKLEYVAIVDLWKGRTVAIEPDTWGSSKATWDWKQASVVVTDPDGVASEVKLRKPARDPYGSDRQGGFWSTDGYWQAPPRPRSRSRRRAPSGGVLDWLFGN